MRSLKHAIIRGYPAARIFRVLKGTVSHSGVYKAAKRFREIGSCLPKVRSTPERSVKTKKLIKISEKSLDGILKRAPENLLKRHMLAVQLCRGC